MILKIWGFWVTWAFWPNFEFFLRIWRWPTPPFSSVLNRMVQKYFPNLSPFERYGGFDFLVPGWLFLCFHRIWMFGQPSPLRYDPGITSVMPVASGCLTRKKTKRCLAVWARCLAVFVDFFHFLLLLVTFFIGRKFCKLLFTGERGKFCYFLLLFYWL
jgi:hypothetical protein